MDESKAIQAHDQLCTRLKSDFNNRVAEHEHWTSTPPPERCSDGSWIFVYKRDEPRKPGSPGTPVETIVVRPDGEAYLVLGACARLRHSLRLGRPLTQERFLGSTRGGKYQNFDRGMAVWEGEPDLAYRVCYEKWGLSPDGTETVKCTGFVAFSDLRGFTNWSQNASPDMIKKTLSSVERCFQQAFSRTWCASLFVKGTGDGMMIVSEADSHDQPSPNHAREFTRACCRFVQYVQDDQNQDIFPKELAIGIGVDFGEFYRIFILGRRDYVGMRINDAAKIQQLAWNEVVISDEHASRLREDDIDIDAISKPLPGKGYRLDVQVFLGEQSALRADSKRGYLCLCRRPPMSGNYFDINHKK